MGFYPPATLVRDGQRRGVEVLPPDVNASGARCVIGDGRVIVGLGYVRTVGEEDAEAVVAERERAGPFADVRDLAQRAPLPGDRLAALVAAGACDSFGRRGASCSGSSASSRAAQTVAGSGGRGAPARAAARADRRRRPSCPSRPSGSGCSPTTAARRSRSASTRWSCCARTCRRARSAAATCRTLRNRSRVAVAGMVVARQRPSTANGVVFMLLEDEHGQVNLIVPPPVYERHRALVRGEPLILARGTFERVGRNRNVVVWQLETLGPLARQISGAASVAAALPDAHHFGHR